MSVKENFVYLCKKLFIMQNTTYETSIRLKHNESPAAIDLGTGGVRPLTPRPNNIPQNKEVFEPQGIFKKDYTNSWRFLDKHLTPLEYKAAHTLAMMAKANTNSLEPLNDETTLKELMEILNVSINKVKPILQKLFDFGVYGKFQVKEAHIPYTKYWVFNPYLSFSGKIIGSDISNLFRNTHCAKAFYDKYYVYIKD
jgi:hypothetical protein